MYVSACVCLYLYPCIALGFTSCILWPIIPGFYRSICTRDGFEHEALEKLGHLIAVVHVDGFLMFGSTPAFTDAVAWISADKKKQFFGTQPVYPSGSQPEKHGLVDTYSGVQRDTQLGHAILRSCNFFQTEVRELMGKGRLTKVWHFGLKMGMDQYL